MKRTALLMITTLALAPACTREKKAEPAAAEENQADESSGSEDTPGGAAVQLGRALGKLAKAGKEMQKATAGGGKKLGPVVNWRKLEPLLPASIGGLEADGELKGSTKSMGQFKISEVRRRYRGGDQKLRVHITDTSLVPMMRAGFAMAQMVNEDSSDGVKKGLSVDGHKGLLEWRKKRERGKLTLLVGGRFLVKLTLRGTTRPDEVVELARKLDLDELAGMKAE